VLERESLERMREPQLTLSETDEMGLTWMLHRIGGRQTFGHGGGTAGQISLLTIVPDAGFAVAVVTNHFRGGEITQAVTNLALREYAGVEEPEPEPLPRPAEELAEYAGRYRAALTEYRLRPADGGLVAEITFQGGFPKRDSPPLPSPPPQTLAFSGDDEVFVPEGRLKGTKGRFLRGPDGEIAWLLMGARLHARVNSS
jgi:hypothetical protein